MKTRISVLLLAAIVSVRIMSAVTIGSFNYILDSTNKTASVTQTVGISGNITIPSSVTYQNVIYSVTSIGSGAFRDCSSLTSVTIPKSVTSIGRGAFNGCTGLNSITIPNSVKSIESYAFSGCTSLTPVTIPNSVTSIGSFAFEKCIRLTSITIPKSVTSIGGRVFYGCTGLTSINVDANNPNYCSVDGVLFNKDKTTLIQYPVGKQGAYAIPNSVTSIGGAAFMESKLAYVTIGNSVTSIGSWAFYKCQSLKSITINAEIPPTLGSEVLHYTNCPIYVPCGTIDAYKAAWPDASRITHSPSSACMYTISTTSANQEWGTTAGDKSVIYPENVVISAIANYGYHFVKWNDNNTENPRTISAVKDVTYTATFAKNTYSITKIANSTQGSISGVSQAEYLDNVTLTATPHDGYHFTQWSDGITTNPRIFVLTQDTTLTAEFARNPTITYVYDSQMGSVTGPATTATGIAAENITFNATPNYGYHFVQWSDGNTENPRTIWLSQDTTFTAEFEKNSYTISTQSANPEWGTTAGDTAALYLDEIEISAAPNYGYHFAYWNIEKYRELIDISSLYTVKFSVPNTWSNPYAWIWETGGQGHWETLSYEKGMYVYRTEQDNMNIIVVPKGPSWGNGQTNDLAITESCCYTISGSTVVKSYDCLFTEVQIDTITTLDTHNPLSIIVASNQNATAKFAKNTYSITTNAEHGTISGNSSAEYLDQVTLSVSSDYGYHFTQWSDGNTNNPRTFVLTRDTTFTAEFAIDKSGTCGKNNLLQWTFADDGTLTISGSGELTDNYTFGLEAPTQMQQLVVGNEVTAIGERAFYAKTTLQKLIIGSNVTSIGKYAFASINNRQLTSLVMPAELLTIGDYAFSGNTYLESIDFNAKLQSIGAYAFKGCYRVSEMTCLATVTPNVGTDALASINSYASLCVPAECLRKYQVDPNWGRFDLCELGTTSTVTENRTVTVEPTDNTAIFTWPTENNAASYSLQITKDGVVFCTLVFNSNGQLTGIAFAPGRNGAAHVPAATMSVAGMSFTVTGLDGASKYAYRLAVTNDTSDELIAYRGEFATTGYTGEVNPGGNPEGIEDVFTDEHKASKILRNGQILILRGEKEYTLTGQEVK